MSFIHLLARDGELKLCDVILILLGIYSFPLVMGCVLILHRLYDALLKRYPFRQIPLMPPKRLALNGHYLSTEADFIERRRRGLSRFMNSIVRHPVLRDDDIVVAFITVPTVPLSCNSWVDFRNLLSGGNQRQFRWSKNSLIVNYLQTWNLGSLQN